MKSASTPNAAAPTMASVSRSRAIWWAALVVLVVNDHLLKGAGLLPGWLTGKLSDFAGLIVAPVVAAFFVPRALAFGSVVTWFCAVKLLPGAAHAMEAATAALGVPWRMWSDPTDVIALAIVPLAWRLAAPPARPSRFRRVLPTLLGAAACLATSPAREIIRVYTSVYLVNSTLAPVEVRIYRASGMLDCDALASAPEAARTASFVPEGCATLDPQYVLPLDRYPLVETSTPPDCDAVILRAPELADTLLVWHRPTPVPLDTYVPGDKLNELGEQALLLERAGTTHVVAGTAVVDSLPAEIALPEASCASLPDPRNRVPTGAGVDAGGGG
jgi:hypothetical protein